MMDNAQLADLRSRARQYRRHAVVDRSSIGFHRGVLVGLGIDLMTVFAGLCLLPALVGMPPLTLGLLVPPLLWTLACQSSGRRAFEGAMVGHVIAGVLLGLGYLALVMAFSGGIH